MIVTGLMALLASGSPASGDPPVEYAQLIVRESVVVRVRKRLPASPSVKWREKKGDRCIEITEVAGAAVTKAASVDFILRGGKRVRAQLEKACPALDYYSGFYLRPSADGRICADRDTVHTRSGGSCMIERFRKLVVDDDK